MFSCSLDSKKMIEGGGELWLRVGPYKVRFEFVPIEYDYFSAKILDEWLELYKDLRVEKEESGKEDVLIRVGRGVNEQKVLMREGSQFEESVRFDGENRFITNYGVGVVGWARVMRQAILSLIGKEKVRLVLHGAAVELGGGNLWVLMAPAGGGKTTTARVLCEQGGRMVSDDSVIIWRGEEQIKASGPGLVERHMLPIAGEWAEPRLVVVKKAKKFELIEITQEIEKVREMMKQVWLLDEEARKISFEDACELAPNIKMYELKLPLGYRGLKKELNEVKP